MMSFYLFPTFQVFFHFCIVGLIFSFPFSEAFQDFSGDFQRDFSSNLQERWVYILPSTDVVDVSQQP